MEYVKIINDYSKNLSEKQLALYLGNSLDTSVCVEEIKNKKYMLSYLKPLNDFVIYSTAVACEDKKEINS